MLGLKPTTTTILLVATSEMRRTVVAQQLEALGYSVIIAVDEPSLANLLKVSRYDLVLADMGSEAAGTTHWLARYSSQLLAKGTPLLMLQAEERGPGQDWTQETLSHRVSAAIRNRNSSDVVSERQARYEGLALLDAESTLFRRRYVEAIFPTEIERARRVHQPLTLLLVDLGQTPYSAQGWQALSARLITSLRQTDMVARWEPQKLLLVLPYTEPGLGRVVAARLLKTLKDPPLIDERAQDIGIGVAAFPQQGATAEALLAAAYRALAHTAQSTPIVSADEQ